MIRISNIIQQEEDALGSLSPSFFLPSLSLVWLQWALVMSHDPPPIQDACRLPATVFEVHGGSLSDSILAVNVSTCRCNEPCRFHTYAFVIS